MIRTVVMLSLAAAVLGTRPAVAQDRTLNLPIGDPERKGREAPLALDVITDTATGAALGPAELAAQLSDVRLLFVGENHTSAEFHDVQLRVIEALHATGRRVIVGLEMYPTSEQAFLDEWCDGLLTEEGFLRLSRWYRNWGYNWRYYRDIFLFARDHRIRLAAVNAPREVVAAVRTRGFDKLTPEEAAFIPSRIALDSADHRLLVKAFFAEAAGMHAAMAADMFEGLYRAQCTWDATMGYNAVRALEAAADPGAVMVVLIGSGHVAYGLGAERQAALHFKGRTASLIPTPVTDAEGRRVTVRASYANFIWGVPYEASTRYPALGASFRDATERTPFTVINVEPRSPAAAAGLQVGDELRSMDGVDTPDREVVNRLMAGKRWGDTADLVVRRAGSTVTLRVRFTRQMPAPRGGAGSVASTPSR